MKGTLMNSSSASETEIRPFRVDTPDEAIADLRRRIAATRWPSRELVADRSQGVQLATIQELARYWTTEYDWRACQAELNALPQFTPGTRRTGRHPHEPARDDGRRHAANENRAGALRARGLGDDRRNVQGSGCAVGRHHRQPDRVHVQ
jgi:Epoxide hydrolase N terminus